MNKRQFLKGMAATAAVIMVPGHVLSGQFEFHQRVSGLRATFDTSEADSGSGTPVEPEIPPSTEGPIMQDATAQERTGVMSTGVPLAEDGGVVWYGEVPVGDLITGDGLANLIGVFSGSSQHSNAGWLHVGLDGVELLIAKRPIRNTILWSTLNHSTINAVFGNRIIKIRGVDYRIRLIKGTNAGSVTQTSGWDIPITHGSEWNRIFYRLTQDVYNQADNKKLSEEPFSHLANYSENDLTLDYRVGSQGTQTLCQENYGSNVTAARGHVGVSHFGLTSVHNGWGWGWRPVLEKVS